MPSVPDTNGNGKLDDFTKPGQPSDPTKDTQVGGSGTYAVMPNPVDGSVWYTIGVFAGRGGVARFDPKTSSPKCTTSPCRASARAAAISTPRAWSGCRWRAAIS